MSTPGPSQSPNPVAPSALVPTGVRIASTMCWVVGILTILIAVAIAIPDISSGAGLPFLAANLLAGAIACAAAVLIRRQWKVGVLFMLLAWGMPAVVGFLEGREASGPFLLFLALLFAGANWKHLH